MVAIAPLLPGLLGALGRGFVYGWNGIDEGTATPADETV